MFALIIMTADGSVTLSFPSLLDASTTYDACKRSRDTMACEIVDLDRNLSLARFNRSHDGQHTRESNVKRPS